MYSPRLFFTFGLILTVIGILLPPMFLIETLRPQPVDIVGPLLLGAEWFKVGLIALGLWIMVLTLIPSRNSRPNVGQIPDEENGKSTPWILVLILLVGFLLRLYKLDSGLWYDEILTYVHFARLPFGEIITSYSDQNQHFLYSILAHFSLLTFGESTWSLRLPAALFGIGSIWAVYLLGARVSSRREAILSAALLTFSYHHIWFSQNARGYIGLLFWTLLSSWLLIRGLREDKSYLWILYAAAVALGVYTHMTMVFIVIGHFFIYLHAIFVQRNQPWPMKWSGLFSGFILAGFFSALLYALVFPQIFGGVLSQGAEKSAGVTVWKNPFWTLYEITRNLEISLASGVPATILLGLFTVGLLSFARSKPVVVYLLLIPALVGVTVVKAIGHPIWPRLFFFSVGFASLILMRGTLVVATRVGSRHLGTIFCIGLIAMSAISVPSVYAPKQDYSGPLKYVQEHYEAGDAIVTIGPVTTFPYTTFYKTGWNSVETLHDLNSLRSRANRTWLIYSMPLYMESTLPAIMATVRREFKIEKEFYGTLSGGTIFVCRSDGASS